MLHSSHFVVNTGVGARTKPYHNEMAIIICIQLFRTQGPRWRAGGARRAGLQQLMRFLCGASVPALQNHKCSSGSGQQRRGLSGSPGDRGDSGSAASRQRGGHRRCDSGCGSEGLRSSPVKPLCVTAPAARWETLTEPRAPRYAALSCPSYLHG